MWPIGKVAALGVVSLSLDEYGGSIPSTFNQLFGTKWISIYPILTQYTRIDINFGVVCIVDSTNCA